jgi:hypothetical protein
MADQADWSLGFDAWQGSVTIEMRLAVRTQSRDLKDTDPKVQGTIIADAAGQHLRRLVADDIKIGGARYTGAREGHWADSG